MKHATEGVISLKFSPTDVAMHVNGIRINGKYDCDLDGKTVSMAFHKETQHFDLDKISGIVAGLTTVVRGDKSGSIDVGLNRTHFSIDFEHDFEWDDKNRMAILTILREKHKENVDKWYVKSRMKELRHTFAEIFYKFECRHQLNDTGYVGGSHRIPLAFKLSSDLVIHVAYLTKYNRYEIRGKREKFICSTKNFDRLVRKIKQLQLREHFEMPLNGKTEDEYTGSYN